MDTLNIYYDHYKETNILRREVEHKRNKYFVIVCALEAVSYMFVLDPYLINSVFNSALSAKLQSHILLGNSIVQTFLWIVTAYAFIRYVQSVLYIERQHIYVKALEEKISEILEGSAETKAFTREGVSYEKDYPIVLDLADIFYKTVIPLLFAAVNIAHIMDELFSRPLHISSWCDLCIFIFIMVIDWFYFFRINNRLTMRLMKHGCIAKASNSLKQLFKEYEDGEEKSNCVL